MRISPVNFTSLPFIQQDSDELQKALKNHQVIGFDVDTQEDFMHIQPQRKGLYVNGDKGDGAETIIPRLKRIRDIIVDFCIPRIETIDTHKIDDPEFKYFLDYSDGHCIEGTKGWEKIPETTYPDNNRHAVSLSLEKNDVPRKDFLKKILSKGGTVTVQKNTYSVFEHAKYYGNPDDLKQSLVENPKFIQTIEKFRELGVKTALGYGFATDYCVQTAVIWLKKLGIKPIVVQDAVKEVERNGLVDPADPIYRDVVVMSTDQLEEELIKSRTPNRI